LYDVRRKSCATIPLLSAFYLLTKFFVEFRPR